MRAPGLVLDMHHSPGAGAHVEGHFGSHVFRLLVLQLDVQAGQIAFTDQASLLLGFQLSTGNTTYRYLSGSQPGRWRIA